MNNLVTEGGVRIWSLWRRRLLVGAIIAFAAIFSFVAGHRGFFPFDQSIVFHGGYRIANGEVLFRDFVAPAGPLVFWLQALAFKVAGISYGTYVGTAAVMNSMAACASYLVVSRIFPGERVWALGAAVLTAVWFYPQFGTPWFENTGYLLALLALLAVLPSKLDELDHSRVLLPLLAGALASAAFFCKQNVGLLALPLPLLVVGCLWAHSREDMFREGISVLLGMTITSVAVSAWVVGRAEPELFAKYFLEVPGGVGAARFADLDTIAQGLGFFVPQIDRLFDSLLTLLLLGAVAVAVYGFLQRREIRGRRFMVAGVVVLALLTVQNSVNLLTRNQAVNGLGFIGVTMGLMGGMGSSLVRHVGRSWPGSATDIPVRYRKRFRLVAGAAVALVFVTVTAVGAKWAIERTAHDIFEQSEFSSSCQLPILGNIRWAEPTEYGGDELRCRELKATIDYLEARRGGVLFVGDFTILPVLAGRDPTSFLLWYHKGLTHGPRYEEDLDRRFLQIVRSPSTRTVVVEQERFFDDSRAATLEDWDETRRFIHGNYSHETTIGNFKVYEQK